MNRLVVAGCFVLSAVALTVFLRSEVADFIAPRPDASPDAGVQACAVPSDAVCLCMYAKNNQVFVQEIAKPKGFGRRDGGK